MQTGVVLQINGVSHFQNVFLVSPQMEPNATDAQIAIMVKNVPKNVIVLVMKGNLKHCKYAVRCVASCP
jgi:hypothetical protein